MTESKSQTTKYQSLNRLTLRGIWLMLESYADDPPELILFENVPRIATRGRHLLEQISQLLRRYGYVVSETTHDCGELGGLAQSRKRFLLVARHAEKVPPFLYEPQCRPLRAVGDVLGRMPLAGDIERAGPMHRLPALQWKTWVRLAFVEAGSDWRSLNRLAVDDSGNLRDYLIVPEHHRGWLGVQRCEEPTGTVAGKSLPGNGAFSIADPRAAAGAAQYQQYGVLRMSDTCGTVIGVKSPGQGRFSVADPRHGGPAKHNNEYRIVPFGAPAGAVTGAHGTGACVQDPRPARDGRLFTKYPVVPWESHAGTVIGGDDVGAYAVADPRACGGFEGKGKYRVTGFGEPAGTVIARSDTGQGAFAVADPRPDAVDGVLAGAVSHSLPASSQNLVCVIRSLDGTWHRPFTTLELAALQSLIDPEEKLELDGLSDQAWRERIGNAVPKSAATAIAEEMGRTLLLAWTGQTFALGSTPIWVRDAAVAIALPSTAEAMAVA